MTEVYVRTTRVEVSCLPEDLQMVYGDSFTLTLLYRGDDRWYVLRNQHTCLADDGSWSLRPRPSEQEDEWVAAHTYSYETALRLATQLAPKLNVRGVTAADAIAAAKAGDPRG